jgi:hypothetical protein
MPRSLFTPERTTLRVYPRDYALQMIQLLRVLERMYPDLPAVLSERIRMEWIYT